MYLPSLKPLVLLQMVMCQMNRRKSESVQWHEGLFVKQLDSHMKFKFIPPVIILVGAVGFMVWFFASGAAMPSL